APRRCRPRPTYARCFGLFSAHRASQQSSCAARTSSLGIRSSIWRSFSRWRTGTESDSRNPNSARSTLRPPSRPHCGDILRHDVHLAGYTYGLRPVATSDAPYVVELRAAGGEFINRGATTIAAQLAWLAHYFERH